MVGDSKLFTYVVTFGVEVVLCLIKVVGSFTGARRKISQGGTPLVIRLKILVTNLNEPKL